MRTLFPSVLAILMAACGVTTLSAATPADGIWQRDLASAWKISQQTGRPLVLFVTMDGCYFCDKMALETYRDPTVRRELSARFVPAVVDSDRYPALVRKLNVEVFPTTVIISPQARVLESFPGYVDAGKFRNRLRNVDANRVSQVQLP